MSSGVINETLLGPAADEWIRIVPHKRVCLSCSCSWALMEARAVFTDLADVDTLPAGTNSQERLLPLNNELLLE